jgi:hypothetical protein
MPTRKSHTEIRAHRILGGMSGYVPAVDGESPQPSEVSAGIGGRLLGVYRNPGPASEHLVITSEGIEIIGKAPPRFIRYSDMEDPKICAMGLPLIEDPPRKSSADSISVSVRGGVRTQLPICGGHDGYRDVFQFWSFLRMAIYESKLLMKGH